MTHIDVAIPGLIGLLLIAWPGFVFWGSRVTPDDRKRRQMRMAGIALMLLATGYLALRLSNA